MGQGRGTGGSRRQSIPPDARRTRGEDLLGRWKDSIHLIRPAAVFVAGIVLFLVIRQLVVPPTFGRFGHYRAAALDEIRARPARYAGQEACAGCHLEQAGIRDKGKHAGVSCEACHGPAARHAEDPASMKPPKPAEAAFCAGCHEKDTAKPAWFRQVQTSEHMGQMRCTECHSAHSPAM